MPDAACYRCGVIAETRSISLAIGAIIVAVAFAVAALATCGRPKYATAPSIAWDGRALTAVWERSDGRGGSTVFAHRFADLRAGVTTIGSGTPVHNQKYGGSWNVPEIASDANGSLVFIVGPRDNHFAIPLDARGAVAGPAQPLTNCSSDSSERICMRTCRRTVAFGDGFALGHLDVWPRAGGVARIGVSFLTRDGKTARDVSLPGGTPSSCAIASTGSRLVVAIAEERYDYTFGISVHVVDGPDPQGLWIPKAVRAIALVWTGVDLALLHEMQDGKLRVARIDDRGVGESVTLPADVDAATADLGVGAHGPFVTWIRGKRVFVRDVATAKKARAAIRGAKPLGTRAESAGGRCVAAWTAGEGTKLGVLSTACP